MTYERNKIFDRIQVITTKNWPYICDHLDRILTTGGSESGKTNELLNLIKHKGLDITKNYLYIRDPLESKYQLLKNGREQVRMGS